MMGIFWSKKEIRFFPFFADFDVFGPILFLLAPSRPPPPKKNPAPHGERVFFGRVPSQKKKLFILYKKSVKNLNKIRISDAGIGKRISNS